MSSPTIQEVLALGDEMFITADERVICRKGENYYRACSEPVRQNDEGGTNYCVKRERHPSPVHEDYQGNTTAEESQPAGKKNDTMISFTAFPDGTFNFNVNNVPADD